MAPSATAFVTGCAGGRAYAAANGVVLLVAGDTAPGTAVDHLDIDLHAHARNGGGYRNTGKHGSACSGCAG